MTGATSREYQQQQQEEEINRLFQPEDNHQQEEEENPAAEPERAKPIEARSAGANNKIQQVAKPEATTNHNKFFIVIKKKDSIKARTICRSFDQR